MSNTSSTNVNTLCTNCFKALGVDTKQKLYSYIKSHKEVSVGELVTYLGLTQPTISFHLKDMHTSGLLDSQRRGKNVFYSINNQCPIYGCDCILKNINFVE